MGEARLLVEAVNGWNKLPPNVLSAPSVEVFNMNLNYSTCTRKCGASPCP